MTSHHAPQTHQILDLRPSPTATPRVSVLVPVWNEEAAIEAVFDDLSIQTLTDLEVIVVDGGSRDGTVSLIEAEISRHRLEVRLLHNPRPSTPEQLNRALEAARGRYVARVDGHVRLPATYLETLVRHLDAGCAAVGVRKTAVADSAFGRALAVVLNSESSLGGSAYHYATEVKAVDHVPYAAYRRAEVVRLGGWDPRFLANQDAELDHRIGRAGGAIVLDGSISTEWRSKGDLRSALRQYWRYGRGRAMTARLHPRTVRFRHVALALLAVLAPAAVLAGLARRRCLAGLLLQPTSNALVAIRSYRRARPPTRQTSTYVLSVAAATCTQLAWGTSYVIALLTPRLLSTHTLERRIARKRRRTYA